jgi:hypothetical protein
MDIYTKQMLLSAYKVGAGKIAANISKRVYEQAQEYPDTFVYQEKLFMHELVAQEILQILKRGFLGVHVSMEFSPEDHNQGMAVFKIDWS